MTRRLSPVIACGLVGLGALSPWLLGFSASHAAVANHIAFAMAFAPLALMIGALRPAAVVCLAGGAWLAGGPWVLGYASQGAAAWGGDLLLGVALMWLSLRALSPVTPPVSASGRRAAALGGGPGRAEPSAERSG